MTFNDLIQSGCQVQGWVEVSTFDEAGRKHVLYDGEGEDLTGDEDWGEEIGISFIYYDRIDECMHIEL